MSPDPAPPDDAQGPPASGAADQARSEEAAAERGGTAQARGQSEDPLARGQGDDYQARADTLVGKFTEGRPPEEAALALAVLVNRAGARLHNLTRAEASAHKDQPAWPVWAQLQNASRSLVLQASTCRDLAARLAGRKK